MYRITILRRLFRYCTFLECTSRVMVDCDRIAGDERERERESTKTKRERTPMPSVTGMLDVMEPRIKRLG